MPTEPRLPRWFGYIVAVVAIVPLVVAVRSPSFVPTAIAMCIAASFGGLWWGERTGTTEGSRAALGCLGAFALLIFYAVCALVLGRWFLD